MLQARLRMLYGEPCVYTNFEVTVHIENIRQTAVVVAVMNPSKLENNKTSSVVICFKRHPEYVSVGSRLIVR